ncbi:MAG: hypothetical protein LBE37_06560, partial [Sphingobacterium sp.]|nr:hypothetical protein [Sphingobacterium sp.]
IDANVDVQPNGSSGSTGENSYISRKSSLPSSKHSKYVTEYLWSLSFSIDIHLSTIYSSSWLAPSHCSTVRPNLRFVLS